VTNLLNYLTWIDVYKKKIDRLMLFKAGNYLHKKSNQTFSFFLTN